MGLVLDRETGMYKWGDRDLPLAFQESIRSIDQSYWSVAGDWLAFGICMSFYMYSFRCHELHPKLISSFSFLGLVNNNFCLLIKSPPELKIVRRLIRNSFILWPLKTSHAPSSLEKARFLTGSEYKRKEKGILLLFPWPSFSLQLHVFTFDIGENNKKATSM